MFLIPCTPLLFLKRMAGPTALLEDVSSVEHNDCLRNFIVAEEDEEEGNIDYAAIESFKREKRQIFLQSYRFTTKETMRKKFSRRLLGKVMKVAVLWRCVVYKLGRCRRRRAGRAVGFICFRTFRHWRLYPVRRSVWDLYT